MSDRRRWREKEPVDKRVYEFRRKRLGEKHPDTIRSMTDLAVTYHQQGSMAKLARTYHAQGRYEEAEKINVEVLALRRDVLIEKHSNTIGSMASRRIASGSLWKRQSSRTI
ncbi:hypothetical protein B0T22DRAFT_482310 [Podospora appendiculata]|uniref:Kinesin light chain n=1 Tax=Podospora appendiculata TaxID=314037 RepID=A0AAE0X596_9PEZI|nr:hypothetical protein B0T22DRAFT_482310 [Podospora appendiculata]